MYTRLLVILAVITLAACFEPGHTKESYIFAKFQTFLKENNKKYNTIEEYMNRFNVFKTNYENIESFTIDPSSTTSYSVGINKFADLTTEEFRRTYLNLDISLLNTLMNTLPRNENIKADAPEEHDWSQKGTVGPVKDQGSCGSCWAFSAVGNIEGLYNNKHKDAEYATFSEQQLVDCDKVDEGCNGGLMENAFEYIKKAGGLESSKDYPYKGRGQKCSFDAKKAAVKLSGFTLNNDMDEEEMKSFLFKTGPLAIALNANTLQFYDGGIIDANARECDPEGLNHGVTLVGYGVEKGKKYWIAKNSWGKNWGNNGYFKMARGTKTCGIHKYVSTAILADD